MRAYTSVCARVCMGVCALCACVYTHEVSQGQNPVLFSRPSTWLSPEWPQGE